MTHQRTVGTIEHALLNVINDLSPGEIEEATGKRPGTFYKAANPAQAAGLHLKDAIALDGCLIARGRPAVFLNIYLDRMRSNGVNTEPVDIEREFVQAVVKIGELGRRIDKAMADGILEQSERQWIAEQAHDLREVIDTILQHVEPPHDPRDLRVVETWPGEGEGAA